MAGIIPCDITRSYRSVGAGTRQTALRASATSKQPGGKPTTVRPQSGWRRTMQPLPPPPPPLPTFDGPSTVNTTHAPDATPKPSMSQVQEELTRFLQDFESVKFLLETPEDVIVPKKLDVPTSVSKRRSMYDNVPSTLPPPPPPPSESSIPVSTSPRTSDPSSSVTTTPEEIIVVNKPPVPKRGGIPNGTFPRAHHQPSNGRFPVEPTSREEPVVCSPPLRRPRTASPLGAASDILPMPNSRGVRGPSPSHANSLPHVQNTTDGHFLSRYDTQETFPTYFTVSGPTCSVCKRLLSEDNRTKKDLMEQPQNTHVHFQMEEKTPPRWGGGSKVCPIKNSQSNRKKHSGIRLALIACAVAIVILSLLGIVVAVTCAVILSALQDEPKGESLQTCHLRIYEARLAASWHFNKSCDVNLNKSLADVTSMDFLRVSKIYELMIDTIFRSSLLKRDFNFSKVEKVKCSKTKNSVFVHFKIYWKEGADVSEPADILRDFLSAVQRMDPQKYNIPSHSVSIEGIRLPQ